MQGWYRFEATMQDGTVQTGAIEATHPDEAATMFERRGGDYSRLVVRCPDGAAHEYGPDADTFEDCEYRA